MKNVPCCVDVLNGFAGSSEDLAADVLDFADLFFSLFCPGSHGKQKLVESDFMFKGPKQR